MGMWVETAMDEFIASLVQVRQITEETGRAMEVAAYPMLRILGRRHFDKIKRVDVERAIQDLVLAGYEPNTVNKAVTMLKRMYDRAIECELVTKNPCVGVIKPRGKKKSVMLELSDDEFQTFIAASHQHKHGLAIRIMAGTGIRRSEMSALRMSDFDGEKIRIVKARTPKRVKVPKTETSRRAVFLPPDVRDELRRLKGVGFKGPILQDKDGCTLGYYYLTQICNEIGEMCGVKVTPHMLRHYHASKLLSENKPLPAVSRRLGHSSPAVTLGIYAHAFDHQDRELAGV